MTPFGGARTCIVVAGDRCASDIARRIVGDETRWRELVDVNPHKPRSRVAGFDHLADGERLVLPIAWPDDPFSHMAVMPGANARERRFEAGALPPAVLPNGWVDDDLKAVMVMASDLGVGDPKSLLYVWASETGVSAQNQLNPKTKLDLPSSDAWSPFFAGGLNGSTALVCRAMGFKSASDWLNAPVRVQLQGILRQYRNHVRALNEGFDARAAKIGTTTAALIYAFNFLPAYAPGLKSPTQAITQAGSAFYDGNRVLDTSNPKKGYICLRDFEVLTAPNRWPSGWPIYALTSRIDDLRADPQLVASLGPTGTSIWAPIASIWQQLTGRPVVGDPAGAAMPVPSSGAAAAAASSGFAGMSKWGPQEYWKATGVVLFAGFLVAYAQGWIRR